MRRVILAPAARQGIKAVLNWSRECFGVTAQRRYDALIRQAISDLAENPDRPGVESRSEIAGKVRTYHLRRSRDRVNQQIGRVRTPRHVLLFRLRDDGTLLISQILHDRMDTGRHLDDDLSQV